MLDVFLLLALSLPGSGDRELADAIRRGDRTAFRRFFDEHHHALLRYLRHKKVDPDVAEDLVQNAFVHIWERRGDIRPDGSLRGLLFRIAYTRALNHFRDTARFDGLEGAPSLVEGVAQDPAETREIRERVAAAVAGLPDRRRAVFELCMLEGFSYREAAEALEISIKTVENHMGHALKAVREQLQPLVAGKSESE